MSAALVGLAFGLIPYSGFLIMARAHNALSDSRTPALASLVCGVVGVCVIVVARISLHERALVGMLGFAHSIAFAVGALLLAATMRRRSGHRVGTRRALIAITCATIPAVPMWLAIQSIHISGRPQLVVLAAIGSLIYLSLYLIGLRILRFGSLRTRPQESIRTSA